MTDQTFSVADNQVKVTADEIAAGEITCSCGVINEATATVCHLCGAEQLFVIIYNGTNNQQYVANVSATVWNVAAGSGIDINAI